MVFSAYIYIYNLSYKSGITLNAKFHNQLFFMCCNKNILSCDTISGLAHQDQVTIKCIPK